MWRVSPRASSSFATAGSEKTAQWKTDETRPMSSRTCRWLMTRMTNESLGHHEDVEPRTWPQQAAVGADYARHHHRRRRRHRDGFSWSRRAVHGAGAN